MRERVKKVSIISAVVLLIGCAYTLFFLKTGIGIPCVFRLVTGWNCPGCGVTRMLISLFRLDLKSAYSHNAVLLCILPVLVAVILRWIYLYIRYGSYRLKQIDRIVCIVLIAILSIWGIVRNIIHM